MDFFKKQMSIKTKINNGNIKKFVTYYITNKRNLPYDLRDKLIGEWDVSGVTVMSDLFRELGNIDFENFNEPLSDWDVSNVTDMKNMFWGCRSFNQPLITDGNKWNVSNVINMRGMFVGCVNFRQSLNSWDVSSVTNMGYMFSGCTNFNQPLNDWKVSNVTTMESMFTECENFNQLLNTNTADDKWNVSRVTNMNRMFQYCTNFNQPLNDWNVSRVTDMGYMFNGCTNFNQSLTGWNISSVTSSDFIFQNCGISRDNAPRLMRAFVPIRPQATATTQRVDPLQVHREASKINYDKLNTFLKEKLGNIEVTSDINYPEFINQSISTLISETANTEERETQQTSDLGRIMRERLNGLNYTEKSNLVRESIFYTLSYVLAQPPAFKEMYLQTFLQDCIHAYDREDGMTCAKGALERIIFSLVPACSTDQENEDYKTIIGIITANPQLLIIEYIKDWYKLHKTGTPTAFPEGTTEEQMKADLKIFLLEKLPGENTLIEQKISEYADNIGYAPDDFMFEGGKRKTKKNRKRTNKVRKTRKIRKTRKLLRRKTNRKKGTKIIKRK